MTDIGFGDLPSSPGAAVSPASTTEVRRLERRLDSLEAFTRSLIHDLVEVHEIARESRENAEAAASAVKEAGRRITALEGHVLGNATDERLVELIALTEYIALGIRAVESRQATLERTREMARRAGRMAAALGAWIARLNEQVTARLPSGSALLSLTRTRANPRALVLLSAALTCLVSDADRRPTPSHGLRPAALESRSFNLSGTTLMSAGSSIAGTVAIDSRPSGATVLIDLRQMGTTPLRASLPQGPHVVWVQREGYQRWTAAVSVHAHKLTSISVTLRRGGSGTSAAPRPPP